jgi:hypothetical protein
VRGVVKKAVGLGGWHMLVSLAISYLAKQLMDHPLNIVFMHEMKCSLSFFNLWSYG